MGYPMTYPRVLSRNRLHGGYLHNMEQPPARPAAEEQLCGDLRRLEQDQRDAWHLECYAQVAGITPDQAKAVLDAFFDGLRSYAPPEPTTETNALRREVEQAQQTIEALRSALQSLHGQCHYRKTLEAVHEQFHRLDADAPRFYPTWKRLFATLEEEAAKESAKP